MRRMSTLDRILEAASEQHKQIVFPEVNIDKVAKIRGMNITLVTTAKTDEEAFELMKIMKFPFRK